MNLKKRTWKKKIYLQKCHKVPTKKTPISSILINPLLVISGASAPTQQPPQQTVTTITTTTTINTSTPTSSSAVTTTNVQGGTQMQPPQNTLSTVSNTIHTVPAQQELPTIAAGSRIIENYYLARDSMTRQHLPAYIDTTDEKNDEAADSNNPVLSQVAHTDNTGYVLIHPDVRSSQIIKRRAAERSEALLQNNNDVQTTTATLPSAPTGVNDPAGAERPNPATGPNNPADAERPNLVTEANNPADTERPNPATGPNNPADAEKPNLVTEANNPAAASAVPSVPIGENNLPPGGDANTGSLFQQVIELLLPHPAILFFGIFGIFGLIAKETVFPNKEKKKK